jgi:hypothetical protein
MLRLQHATEELFARALYQSIIAGAVRHLLICVKIEESPASVDFRSRARERNRQGADTQRHPGFHHSRAAP